MSANVSTLPVGPALPSTAEALLSFRKRPANASLNDLVEQIHVALWPSQEYQDLWDAIFDEQAVNGSMSIDDVMAASMVREYAKEHRDENGFSS